jgi:hypothetical protein
VLASCGRPRSGPGAVGRHQKDSLPAGAVGVGALLTTVTNLAQAYPSATSARLVESAQQRVVLVALQGDEQERGSLADAVQVQPPRRTRSGGTRRSIDRGLASHRPCDPDLRRPVVMRWGRSTTCEAHRWERCCRGRPWRRSTAAAAAAHTCAAWATCASCWSAWITTGAGSKACARARACVVLLKSGQGCALAGG